VISSVVNNIYTSTSVVSVLPICKTNIAKLMLTQAFHMIATFSFFNKDPTLRATFEFLESLLEVQVTRAQMFRELTFFTKNYLAVGALKSVFCYVNDPLAMICWT